MLRHQPACRRATSPYFRPLITRKIEDPTKYPRTVTDTHAHGPDVEAPQRGDVIAGLKLLAGPSPIGEHWPDLTAAVNWVVDDTFWDRRDPADDIGILLRDPLEANGLRCLVGQLVKVCSTLGEAPDADYVADPHWSIVQYLARDCLAILQSPGDRDGAILWVLDESEDLPRSVELREGRSLLVRDIAFGYDIDDDDAHITANTDPGPPDNESHYGPHTC